MAYGSFFSDTRGLCRSAEMPLGQLAADSQRWCWRKESSAAKKEGARGGSESASNHCTFMVCKVCMQFCNGRLTNLWFAMLFCPLDLRAMGGIDSLPVSRILLFFDYILLIIEPNWNFLVSFDSSRLALLNNARLQWYFKTSQSYGDIGDCNDKIWFSTHNLAEFYDSPTILILFDRGVFVLSNNTKNATV